MDKIPENLKHLMFVVWQEIGYDILEIERQEGNNSGISPDLVVELVLDANRLETTLPHCYFISGTTEEAETALKEFRKLSWQKQCELAKDQIFTAEVYGM